MAKPILANAAKYREAPFSLVVHVLSRGEIAPGGCYLWSGRTDQDGYGTTNYSCGGQWRIVLIHRLIYTRLVGDPGVFPVDHLCHDPASCSAPPSECPHRRCMSPEHLKAVPHAANIARGSGLAALNAQKTHCKSGHEFTPANTYWRPTGGRACKTCASLREMANRAAARIADEELTGRRQASAAKRDRVATLLGSAPERPDNQVADEVGCSAVRVAGIRANLRAIGLIAEPGYRLGADGKIYRKGLGS